MRNAPTTRPASAYFPLLDLIRIAAAAGVVWIHVAGGEALAWTKELGRFGVPFFGCSAVYLAVGSVWRHPGTSPMAYAGQRFKRVYVLFLVWSAFYLAFRDFSARFVEHAELLKVSLLDFFWNGVAIQLWFLPFIFLATCGTFAVAKMIQKTPLLRGPVVVVLAVIAVAAALAPLPDFIAHGGYTVGLGYEIVPACCAGLGLGLLFRASDVEKGSSKPNAVLLVTGGILFLLWLVCSLCSPRSIALENVAGFGLLLAALGWTMTTPMPRIAALGSASFGIYLVHPLFVEGLQHLLPKLGFRAGSSTLEIGIFLASLLASLLAVILLRRWKSTAWLAG